VLYLALTPVDWHRRQVYFHIYGSVRCMRLHSWRLPRRTKEFNLDPRPYHAVQVSYNCFTSSTRSAKEDVWRTSDSAGLCRTHPAGQRDQSTRQSGSGITVWRDWRPVRSVQASTALVNMGHKAFVCEQATRHDGNNGHPMNNERRYVAAPSTVST
jgi:hypothetical protein